MRKQLSFFACLPLLVSSCTTERTRALSVASAMSSRESVTPISTSNISSRNFGTDPTSVYEREEADLIRGVNNTTPYYVRTLSNVTDGLFGPAVSCKDGSAWANVKVEGDERFSAGIKGQENFQIAHAYNDYKNGALLDGRHFEGAPGDWPFYVYITEDLCRNPSEAFVRVVFVAKDNLDAITGYALAVVYPTGEPIDAKDPESKIIYPDVEEREPGPVWLYWKSECVYEGVRFPKVEGLYQRIDPDRVEAALDIMVEKAKGHYFAKES